MNADCIFQRSAERTKPDPCACQWPPASLQTALNAKELTTDCKTGKYWQEKKCKVTCAKEGTSFDYVCSSVDQGGKAQPTFVAVGGTTARCPTPCQQAKSWQDVTFVKEAYKIGRGLGQASVGCAAAQDGEKCSFYSCAPSFEPTGKITCRAGKWTAEAVICAKYTCTPASQYFGYSATHSVSVLNPEEATKVIIGKDSPLTCSYGYKQVKRTVCGVNDWNTDGCQIICDYSTFNQQQLGASFGLDKTCSTQGAPFRNNWVGQECLVQCTSDLAQAPMDQCVNTAVCGGDGKWGVVQGSRSTVPMCYLPCSIKDMYDNNVVEGLTLPQNGRESTVVCVLSVEDLNPPYTDILEWRQYRVYGQTKFGVLSDSVRHGRQCIVQCPNGKTRYGGLGPYCYNGNWIWRHDRRGRPTTKTKCEGQKYFGIPSGQYRRADCPWTDLINLSNALKQYRNAEIETATCNTTALTQSGRVFYIRCSQPGFEFSFGSADLVLCVGGKYYWGGLKEAIVADITSAVDPVNVPLCSKPVRPCDAWEPDHPTLGSKGMKTGCSETRPGAYCTPECERGYVLKYPSDKTSRDWWNRGFMCGNDGQWDLTTKVICIPICQANPGNAQLNTPGGCPLGGRCDYFCSSVDVTVPNTQDIHKNIDCAGPACGFDGSKCDPDLWEKTTMTSAIKNIQIVIETDSPLPRNAWMGIYKPSQMNSDWLWARYLPETSAGKLNATLQVDLQDFDMQGHEVEVRVFPDQATPVGKTGAIGYGRLCRLKRDCGTPSQTTSVKTQVLSEDIPVITTTIKQPKKQEKISTQSTETDAAPIRHSIYPTKLKQARSFIPQELRGDVVVPDSCLAAGCPCDLYKNNKCDYKSGCNIPECQYDAWECRCPEPDDLVKLLNGNQTTIQCFDNEVPAAAGQHPSALKNAASHYMFAKCTFECNSGMSSLGADGSVSNTSATICTPHNKTETASSNYPAIKALLGGYWTPFPQARSKCVRPCPEKIGDLLSKYQSKYNNFNDFVNCRATGVGSKCDLWSCKNEWTVNSVSFKGWICAPSTGDAATWVELPGSSDGPCLPPPNCPVINSPASSLAARLSSTGPLKVDISKPGCKGGPIDASKTEYSCEIHCKSDVEPGGWLEATCKCENDAAGRKICNWSHGQSCGCKKPPTSMLPANLADSGNCDNKPDNTPCDVVQNQCLPPKPGVPGFRHWDKAGHDECAYSFTCLDGSWDTTTTKSVRACLKGCDPKAVTLGPNIALAKTDMVEHGEPARLQCTKGTPDGSLYPFCYNGQWIGADLRGAKIKPFSCVLPPTTPPTPPTTPPPPPGPRIPTDSACQRADLLNMASWLTSRGLTYKELPLVQYDCAEAYPTFTVDGTFQLSCIDEHYRLEGNLTWLVCDERGPATKKNGNWLFSPSDSYHDATAKVATAPNAPICRRVTCPDTKTLNGACSGDGGRTKVKERCDLTCENGFTPYYARQQSGSKSGWWIQSRVCGEQVYHVPAGAQQDQETGWMVKDSDGNFIFPICIDPCAGWEKNSTSTSITNLESSPGRCDYTDPSLCNWFCDNWADYSTNRDANSGTMKRDCAALSCSRKYERNVCQAPVVNVFVDPTHVDFNWHLGLNPQRRSITKNAWLGFYRGENAPIQDWIGAIHLNESQTKWTTPTDAPHSIRITIPHLVRFDVVKQQTGARDVWLGGDLVARLFMDYTFTKASQIGQAAMCDVSENCASDPRVLQISMKDELGADKYTKCLQAGCTCDHWKDGTCDAQCNEPACNYDGGDCRCPSPNNAKYRLPLVRGGSHQCGNTSLIGVSRCYFQCNPGYQYRDAVMGVIKTDGSLKCNPSKTDLYGGTWETAFCEAPCIYEPYFPAKKFDHVKWKCPKGTNNEPYTTLSQDYCNFDCSKKNSAGSYMPVNGGTGRALCVDGEYVDVPDSLGCWPKCIPDPTNTTAPYFTTLAKGKIDWSFVTGFNNDCGRSGTNPGASCTYTCDNDYVPTAVFNCPPSIGAYDQTTADDDEGKHILSFLVPSPANKLCIPKVHCEFDSLIDRVANGSLQCSDIIGSRMPGEGGLVRDGSFCVLRCVNDDYTPTSNINSGSTPAVQCRGGTFIGSPFCHPPCANGIDIIYASRGIKPGLCAGTKLEEKCSLQDACLPNWVKSSCTATEAKCYNPWWEGGYDQLIGNTNMDAAQNDWTLGFAEKLTRATPAWYARVLEPIPKCYRYCTTPYSLQFPQYVTGCKDKEASETNPVKHGESCTVQCEKGATRIGSTDVICHDGIFRGPFPTTKCVKNDNNKCKGDTNECCCLSELNPVVGSARMCLDDCATQCFGPGYKYNVSCHTGWQLRDTNNNYVLCSVEGRWVYPKPVPPRCITSQCGCLDVPNSKTGAKTCCDQPSSTPCVVQCKEGYTPRWTTLPAGKFSNQAMYEYGPMCEDGEWNNKVPTCVPKCTGARDDNAAECAPQYRCDGVCAADLQNLVSTSQGFTNEGNDCTGPLCDWDGCKKPQASLEIMASAVHIDFRTSRRIGPTSWLGAFPTNEDRNSYWYAAKAVSQSLDYDWTGSYLYLGDSMKSSGESDTQIRLFADGGNAVPVAVASLCNCTVYCFRKANNITGINPEPGKDEVLPPIPPAPPVSPPPTPQGPSDKKDPCRCPGVKPFWKILAIIFLVLNVVLLVAMIILYFYNRRAAGSKEAAGSYNEL